MPRFTGGDNGLKGIHLFYPLVTYDFTIFKGNHPPGSFNHPGIVSAENKGDVFFTVHPFHYFQKIVCGGRVQVGGGFISEDELWS